MKRVSLRTKLLLSTVLACVLIVVMISFVDVLRFSEAEKKLIEEEFLTFEQGAKQTIREAVWRYDWDMVETILASQASSFISFVKICDTKVSRCLERGTPDVAPYLDFQTPILYGEEDGRQPVEIGSIYLQSHYQTFSSHLFKDLPRLLFANILSVSGVALVLFFMFHRLVVKRLLALARFTSRIDLQEINSADVQFGSNTTRWRDEIDLLTDALGDLLNKTRTELERRQTLEKQLSQTQKMEALGNLAGGIAHDFNNILAAILGFAELGHLKSTVGSEISRYFEQIISAGQRAKNLASQILVFSRSSEQSLEIVNMTAVVKETLDLMRASLPACIRITTALDPDVRVKGDSTRLHQVIMNIATNGAQAIGERNGILHITLRSVSVDQPLADALVLQPGKYCCLKIADDGDGIPEEILPRVFEPFFTTKAQGKGTGMGLAVVHGIVQSYGGAIAVDSHQGSGTMFAIYLPQTDLDVSETSTRSGTPRGNGERIVLIDDEQQVLEMGESILKNLGYTVTSFQDPEAVLDHVKQDPSVKLVITDLTMPAMNGVALAALLKTRRPDLPVLLWTGYKDDIAAKSLDSKVIDRILQKPFDLEDLADVVFHALSDSPRLQP